MWFLSFFTAFLVVVSGAEAQIHISVDTVQRYFLEGEKRFQTLRVTNNHKEDTFEIGSELMLYTNIRERDRKEAEFEPVQGHFLLAPKKFTLKPGQTRSVRLVHTKGHTNEERVYRLNFKPQDLQKPDALSNENATGIKPSTRIVLAAGMLILASPTNPNLNLDYERDEQGIVFTNTGNVAADLRLTREHCYTSDEGSGCMKLPGKRVYPGESWRFEIEPYIPIRWAVTSYNELKQWLNIAPIDSF
jgi:P pilus assembly chaperone PapD